MAESPSRATQADLSWNERFKANNIVEATKPIHVHRGESADGYVFVVHARDNDLGTAKKVIWQGDSDYVFPDAAETLGIRSTSASDTDGGTGARTVLIKGLDANYDLIEETVTLNGTTEVTTTQEFLRVNEVNVETVGSNMSTVGTITVDNTTSSNILSHLVPGDNNSSAAVYTIPRNHTAYIVEAVLSCGAGKTVDLFIQRRLPGANKAFHTYKELVLYQSTIRLATDGAAELVGKTDFRIVAKSDASATPVSANVILIVLKDE